jgi:hypothetical protein
LIIIPSGNCCNLVTIMAWAWTDEAVNIYCLSTYKMMNWLFMKSVLCNVVT